MAQINEDLIRSVFAEMVKYKTSLQKYLIVDEDEKDVDYRILGDLIIKNFPGLLVLNSEDYFPAP